MNNKKHLAQVPGAPAAIGPYSPAVTAADLVYISGQIPLDPTTNEIVADDFESQARQVFANLAAICSAAGGSLEHLVKMTVYMTDLSNFAQFNKIATEILAPPYPARAAIGVAALPKNAQVEIEALMLAS